MFFDVLYLLFALGGLAAGFLFNPSLRKSTATNQESIEDSKN